MSSMMPIDRAMFMMAIALLIWLLYSLPCAPGPSKEGGVSVSRAAIITRTSHSPSIFKRGLRTYVITFPVPRKESSRKPLVVLKPNNNSNNNIENSIDHILNKVLG